MPFTNTLTHPLLMTSGMGTLRLNKSCAIYEQALSDPSTLGEAGTPTLLSGHDAIACSVQRSMVKSTEKRMDKTNPAIALYAIYLDAVYASITTGMQAVISGVTYNILAVHHASSGSHTQLEAERITT